MSKIEQSRSAVFSELNGVMAVATHRNFRAASVELGVSASALSHAVANLERRVGVKLFHRTTRSVSPSQAGEHFLERVQPAMRQIAEAMETVNAFREKPIGTLRINTAEAAARRIFEPVVLAYVKRYPDVSVDLATDGRLVDIVAKGFDAGIRLKETVPRDMVAVPCSSPMRFVVVGSPEYFKRHPRPRSPGDLLAHSCVRRRRASGVMLRWEFEKNGEEVTLDVHGALTVDADALAIAAVLGGVGLTWVNEWSVESLIAERRLVTVLDDWCPRFPGLCLYYPPQRHASAALRALVQLVREMKIEPAPAGAEASAPRRRGTGRR